MELVEEARFLRLLLEKAAVELVCGMACEDDLNWLDENIRLQEFYLEGGSPEKLLELDNEMHKKLFSICRKELTYNMCQRLAIHYDRIRSLSVTTVKDYKIIGEHRELLDAIRSKDTKNQEVLAEKKAKMEGRMKIYRQRLRDIYINGQINYLDVLLGAKDFSDFSSRMFLLQKIISRDLAMMDTIMKETAEIEARQKELDAQMADIEKMRSDLDEKQQKAEASKEERAQLLYRAEEESRQADEDYDRLLAISENIASMLRSLERSSSMPTGGGTGKFIWPVTGEITSYYGWRTHPVFGTTRYHSGMDIACDYGTPIVAADSGTVIYSGWMGGYGYAVMIDHGGGLVSLYGHNQELAVSEGQYVNKGQVISYAGSTGWSTGPHCHFEVRIHGEVTEPLDYLP